MFSYWLRGYAGRSCIMTIRLFFLLHLKVRHRSSCIASWHLVFNFAVDSLVLVICTQLGLRKFFLFGTGLTGLIHRSDRLLYVGPGTVPCRPV